MANILSVFSDLVDGSIIIDVYTDLWIPIDRNDQLQVDLAESNQIRLTSLLREIRDVGFSDVYPNEGEEHVDEILPQKGFKVYMHKDAIYHNVPDDLKEVVDKYYWENVI